MKTKKNFFETFLRFFSPLVFQATDGIQFLVISDSISRFFNIQQSIIVRRENVKKKESKEKKNKNKNKKRLEKSKK